VRIYANARNLTKFCDWWVQ